LVPGIFCGWLLARKDFFAKPAFEALLFMPMVLPPTVPGYLLLVTFGSQGVMGRWLKSHFDIEFVFNWKGAVLASAIIAFPLMVQAAKLSVQMIDQRLEKAASSLGASPIKVWFSVTLPLMFPGVLVGLIMVFSRSLGEFGATITFVGNIVGETQTLPLAIYSATHQIDGDSMAIRLILISLSFAFFALLLSNILSRRAEKWLGVNRA
jgi:molybdate transport system permease protein